MILLRITLLLFFSEFLSLKVTAQDLMLKVGDKMPDYSFGKFMNDPVKKLKLSQLKGKLIILDFWNIHCAVCIDDMPKMDSLQRRFAGQLQIIMVTRNSEEEANKLFSRIKIKRPDIPCIVNDTIWNSIFPHNGDPLHVWITPEGSIYAITNYYDTYQETVRQFLEGKNPILGKRWDFGINPTYSLVSEQNSSTLGKVTSYSAFFKGLEEYSNENSIVTKPTNVEIINAPILTLYNIAYNNEIYGFPVSFFRLRNNKRILIETKNPQDFYPPAEQSRLSEWIEKNIYSYELKIPVEKAGDIFRYMQEDLSRYLPFNAMIEKRKINCLVLIESSNSKKDINVTGIIAQLIYANPESAFPIVNETSLSGNIDIGIKSKLTDIQAVNRELKRYGLILIEKVKDIDMLIIRDKVEK